MAQKKDFSIVGALISQPIEEAKEEKPTQPQKATTPGTKGTHYKYNLSSEELDLLKAVAMVKGITIKELIKQALNNYFKENAEATKTAKDFLNSIKK